MRREVFFGMLSFIFSIVVAFPVILPYFHSGYFPTHDGEWAVVRLGEMFRELRDLQIPARYGGALNFGYGYPLFNFVYPFPYYLGTFIHFLGFGFVGSIKILFGASVPFSAFFIFLASSSLWKSTWAGIVSAIMYVYLPYRMVDLYVRGSIGESLSFALFPLLFYLAIKLVDKAYVLLVVGIAISVAVLIVTHNIMTVLFMPIFIAFVLSQIIFNKKKIIKPFIISIILGLGLSAFFWIPALVEKNNILLSQIPIADRDLYFVRPDQLLFSRWGYGVPTDPNGFSYQFGMPHLIILVLVIFVLLLKIRHSGESGFAWRLQNLSPAFLLISIVLVYIFLLFKQSVFLWKLPFLSEINYPWIALGILGFLVSLLAGFLCIDRWTKYIAICLSFFSIVMVLPYAKPQYFINRDDHYYLTNEATTTSSNELMPLWVKKFPLQRPVEKIEIVKGVGIVKNVFYNSKKIIFDVLAEENVRVRVNTIYYPGWSALTYPSWCRPDQAKPDLGSFWDSSQAKPDQNDSTCEGRELTIDYQHEKGVMQLQIPKGENKVELKFSETSLRMFADIISGSSVILLFLYKIVSRKIKSLRLTNGLMM